MNLVIQQLLIQLETGETDIKLSCLEDICDYLEHPYPNEDGYVETVQRLVILLGKEKDPEILKPYVRAIEQAYMYPIDLSEIDFEPLIDKLNNTDPLMIRNVLYLLSMTFNRKYIPVIEKYLSHTDEEVRKEAAYILETW